MTSILDHQRSRTTQTSFAGISRDQTFVMAVPTVRLKLITCIRAVAVAGLLCFSNISVAELIAGYPDDFRYVLDPREVALLPQYCKYTQVYRKLIPEGNNAAEIDRMYATLGRGFHALHHYCWAIVSTHRALFLAQTKQTRDFYLDQAVRDIDFVIANSPTDFVLLPELFTEKAKNLIRLGKGAVAVNQLERAIELKPDYWPPYAVLSDYYKDQGVVAKAREVLEQGLSAVPEAKPLRTRLAELTQPGARRRP